MVLRLVSGSVTPASAVRNSSDASNVDERDVVVAAEQAHDLLGLAEPQQAVVDEHAGELVADRLVDQHGGDRRIDAAREAADHACPCRPGARIFSIASSLKARMVQSPVQPAMLRTKLRRMSGAVRRVHDLEMELGGVELARLVGDHGDRRVGRGADDAEARPAAWVTRSPWLIQTG